MSTIKVDTILDTSGNTQFTPKAWLTFTGTGTIAIRKSGNISSITDNGTGWYSMTVANAMPSVNYLYLGTIENGSGSQFMQPIDAHTTTSNDAFSKNLSGTPSDSSLIEALFLE